MLCSEVTQWKTILALMQCSQCKVRVHPKWGPRKELVSLQGNQNVQDKQPTQHQLTPKSKWRTLQNYWNFQSRNVQTSGHVYHGTSGQNLDIEDQVDPLERNLCGHPLAGSLWERQFEKFNSKMDGKMYQIGKAYSCIESKVRSCLCTWMTSHWLTIQQTLSTMWKKLMKLVDPGELASFRDHVYSGCTQIQKDVRITKLCWSNWEVTWLGKIACEKQSLGLMTWKVMRRNAWNHFAIWRTKRSSNCMRSRHHVLKCLYVARNGRPKILWSVNKLARAVTKSTRACDSRLARLICYIHTTSNCRQYCHVGNTAQHCRFGLFLRLRLCWGLEDSRSTSGENSIFFLEVGHSFPEIGCVGNKLQSHAVVLNLKLFL